MLAVPDGLYDSVLEQIKEGANYQKVKAALKSMILAEFVQCEPDGLDLDLRDGVNNWNRLHGYRTHTSETAEGAKLIDDANYFLNYDKPESYPRRE